MSKDEDSELARLLPGVRRLHSDKVGPYRDRARRQHSSPIRQAETPIRDHSSNFSGSSVESHFNSGLQIKLQRKLRQGAIRPQSSIDLHGCRQQEAIRLLEDFFDDARHRGDRMLLVIHGKGYRSEAEAVLKPLVHRWLAEQPAVLAWCPAQARDGGAGASYVYLRVN